MPSCFKTLGLIGLALSASWQAHAFEPFVVDGIEFQGLGRLSDASVQEYLPIEVGSRVGAVEVQAAIRALYASGLFADVSMQRDEQNLIVRIEERPTVASFEIDGNKDIPTEELTDNLRAAGLAAGKPLNPLVLAEVKQVLTEQYFNRGKYAATIATSVTDQQPGLVDVRVDIKEGKRAKIRSINMIGNEVFSDKKLAGAIELSEGNIMSIYKRDNLYSREALLGDMERLQSFYQNRGYAQFEIDSVDVSISPDKRDVFISILMNEGDVYNVVDVSVTGDTILDEEDFKSFILVEKDEPFNRQTLVQSIELMKLALAGEGYANAEVEPQPKFNDESLEVKLNFAINPGKRVYVRNINFLGPEKVDDEVFRREMRQMEGAYLSSGNVERSRQRVQRLAFVKNVAVDTRPVPGSEDLVDVNFEIEEGLPAQLGGGIGYSGEDGVTLNGNLVHSNFLGKGDTIRAELVTTDFRDVFSFAHSDPYVTPNAVSRTYAVSYRDVDRLFRSSSLFESETLRGSLEYGWPLSEHSRFRLGGALQTAELVGSITSSEQSVNFIQNNGDSFIENGLPSDDCLTDSTVFCGTDFLTWELFGTWAYDTRDRLIFPRSGSRHRIQFATTLPGSEVEYFTTSYDFIKYWNVGNFLNSDLLLTWRGEFAFGEPIGDTTDLPPYKNFFGGGPDSIRGFDNSSLGPRDTTGRTYGGNLKTISQVELILPAPQALQDTVRFSAFYDIGNVFYTGKGNSVFTEFSDLSGAGGAVLDTGFDFKELRQSAGLAVSWQSPLGLFKFSYAVPLDTNGGARNADGTTRVIADEIERFQFSVGSAF